MEMSISREFLCFVILRYRDDDVLFYSTDLLFYFSIAC